MLANHRHFGYVQRCLISGRNNASCFEKTADYILFVPSSVWANYDNNGKPKKNFSLCISAYMNPYGRPHGRPIEVALKNISGLLVLLTVNILSLPFLVLGLPLKACVLSYDSTAKYYSKSINEKILKSL